MKKPVLCFLLGMVALLSMGQASKEDSLLQELTTTQIDTSRAILYNQLCKSVIQTHPDQALKYALSGYEIAEKNHFIRGLCLITNNIAICHSRLGNLDTALVYYRKALEYRYQYGNKVLIADVNNNIGSLYYRQGKFREALREYDIAEKTYLEAGDKKGAAGILNNKGSILKEMGRHSDALELYMRSSDLYREIGDKSKQAMVAGNIGMVYHVQKFYDKALDQFHDAEAIQRELGDLQGVVASLNSQGEVYADQGDHARALNYFEQAMQLSQETGFKYGHATALLSIGQSYTRMSDARAPEYIERARKLYEESGFSQGEMVALHWEGHWLVDRKEYAAAFHPLQKSLAMALAQESNNHVLVNYEYLAKAYAGMGKYKEALDFHALYDGLQDSLFDKESTERVAEMQARYELAENERRIAQLEREKADEALAGAMRSRAIWYLVGGIVIIALVLVLILALLLIQRRHASAMQTKNTEIEGINASLESAVQARTADLLAVNRELDTFLHESTHALRRPLTRIIGISNLLENEREKTDEYLTLIGRTVENMDAMLEKLIQVDETNHRNLQRDHVEVKPLAEKIAQRFAAPHVQFHLHIPEGYSLLTDRYLLNVLLTNLVENAVQFPRSSAETHHVTIELIPSNQSDELKVTDTGMGIDPATQPFLFEMFYRGTEHSKGNGLGLYVVSKVLQRLEGKVRVHSQPGEYATFVVTLPRRG